MDEKLARILQHMRESARPTDDKTAATHAFGFIYAAELSAYTSGHMARNFGEGDMTRAMWGEVYKCVKAAQYIKRRFEQAV